MVRAADTVADSGVMGSASMVLNLPRFGKSSSGLVSSGERTLSFDSRSTSSSGHSRPPPSLGSHSNAPAVRLKKGFFGRSKSNATSEKRPPSSNSAHSSQREQQERRGITSPLPPAAIFSTEPGLRTTTSSDSSRSALFSDGRSSRRQGSTSSSTFRPPSRTEEVSSPVPALSRESSISETDYDQTLRAQSLTPKTAKHSVLYQLPPLATVVEKDRESGFWSPSTHLRPSWPRKYINGFEYEDLSQKTREMGIATGSSSSRSASSQELSSNNGQPDASPVSPPDVQSETIFDEMTETRFNPDDGARTLQFPKTTSHNTPEIGNVLNDGGRGMQPAKLVPSYSKRYSCLVDVDAQWQQDEQTFKAHDQTLDDGASDLSYNLDSPRVITATTAYMSNVAGLPVLLPLPEGSDKSTDDEDDAEQPLPSPTAQVRSKQASQPFRASSAMHFTRMPQTTPTEQPPPSPESRNSSRSSHFTYRSPAFSSLASDAPASLVWSDATWEDDVDFIYEQEAEATCDFNWTLDDSGGATFLNDDDVSLPVTPLLEDFPSVPKEMDKALQKHGLHTIVEQPQESQRVSSHTRGSSVGHRGFLAARKSSADFGNQSYAIPNPLNIAPKSAVPNTLQAGSLSPVLSVVEERTPTSPFTPSKMQFPAAAAGNADNLIDREGGSSTSSTRRNSSHGAPHETAARPPYTTSGRDSNRWSMASGTSVPSLVQNRANNRTSFSKKIISLPLESFAHEGSEEAGGGIDGDSTMSIPSSYQNGRSSFIMRRPLTSGDRVALQAAGMPVQRYRPGAPGPQVHSLEPSVGRTGPPARPARPDWI